MVTTASIAKLLAALAKNVGTAAVAPTSSAGPPNPPLRPDGGWPSASYTMIALLFASTMMTTGPASAQPGSAAELAVQEAISEMVQQRNRLRAFPISDHYYEEIPCAPIAASELAALDRMNKAAAELFVRFSDALARYRSESGGGGGADNSASYEDQGRAVDAEASETAEEKRTAIEQRKPYRVCGVQLPEYSVGSVPSGGSAAPAGTPEQRAARLEAVKQLRTGEASKSGTDVIPSLRRPDRDPSAQAREDAAARMNEAEVDRHHNMGSQPLADGAAKPAAPPAANPPPEEKQPPEEKPPTQLPDVEAEDAPPDFGGKGTVGAGLPDPTLEYRDIRLPPEKGKGGGAAGAGQLPAEGEGAPPAGAGQPPAETEGAPPAGAGQSPAEAEGAPPAGAGKPPRKPRPSRPGRPTGPPTNEGPVEPLPPVGEPQSEESILDELEEYGPAGDLRPDTSVLDGLAIEFNKARDGCDLKTFLEVRARYIEEIRRNLSKPNLSSDARQYYERLLKAAEETAVPVRVSLPCPILIR